MNLPLYPAMFALWASRFRENLLGLRFDWEADRMSAQDKSFLGVHAYLEHADSILVWINVLPAWISSHDVSIQQHLDVLVPAVEHCIVVVRLANDLATFAREQNGTGENNVLMYGVSPKWVKAEITKHAERARQRLAALCTAGFTPAVEVIRLMEWAIAFYAIADLRADGGPFPGLNVRQEAPIS
jgi:hypothetical protein